MKLLLLVAMAAASLFAPRADAATAADLIGTWSVDVEKTWAILAASPDMAQMTAEQMDMIKQQASLAMGTMTIDITADTMTANIGGQTKKQTYKVTGIEGNVISMEGTDDTGKKESSTAEMKDGQMHVMQGGDESHTVVLTRKEAKAADVKPADVKPADVKPAAPTTP